MAPHKLEYVAYLAGVAILGLAYYPLKRIIQPDWLFVLVVIVAILAIRGFGILLRGRQ